MDPVDQTDGELFNWVCSKPRREHQFWFLFGMLNTGARPAAVLELGRNQVEWDHQLEHLNPPGRRQQLRKLRPSIRISNCLWDWMHYRDNWEHWVGYGQNNQPIANMKNMAKRVRAELGWEEYCTYSIRHFVSTHLYARMRANGVADAKQQLAYVLGHSGELNSTTDRYIKYSPDFMSAPIDAVDDLMKDIQEHTKYELFAPKTHPKP
ncbi:hypothetical protein [Nisaea sp.]|uniref:hypothetical protein n=1 Tax=Nisaea sp. TaxID=2024842 RepID=UPI002B26A20C|nr:hypothetical protein [Nisaea sp.]